MDRLLKCSSCGITYLVTAQERATATAGIGAQLCPGCKALGRLVSRCRGTIKWFDPRRGYGFIKPQHGDQVFFHRSDLQLGDHRPVRRGLEVEMEIEGTEQGPRARCVAPLQDRD